MMNQRTARQHGTVRRRVATAAIAIGVVLFGIAVAPGVASAHIPIVTGQTQCRIDSWTVTWTATADEVRGSLWEIIDPAGYAPAGPQPDSVSFTRTVTYPATQESATETVSAVWTPNAGGQASATVARPPLCEVPTTPATTTTTTTTSTTTTTTLPEVTTTTAGATTTTAAATTTVVGQEGPTSTVDQSSGAATTTVPVAGTLPATGSSSTSLIVIALTMIGIGAVMLRLTTRSTL